MRFFLQSMILNRWIGLNFVHSIRFGLVFMLRFFLGIFTCCITYIKPHTATTQYVHSKFIRWMEQNKEKNCRSCGYMFLVTIEMGANCKQNSNRSISFVLVVVVVVYAHFTSREKSVEKFEALSFVICFSYIFHVFTRHFSISSDNKNRENSNLNVFRLQFQESGMNGKNAGKKKSISSNSNVDLNECIKSWYRLSSRHWHRIFMRFYRVQAQQLAFTRITIINHNITSLSSACV